MSESPSPSGGITEGLEAEQVKEGVDVVKCLSDGFMGTFLPEMENIQQRVKELTLNQDILIETMQQENAKFSEDQLTKDLVAMISYVGMYQNKLLKVRQDMTLTQDRVIRLKKRALKLKAQKEKEELSRAEARERERELERQLTAKLATEYRQ